MSETYQVQITNPLNEQYWYADHVGATFTVRQSGDPEDWQVAEGKHAGQMIIKAACTVVQ